MTQRISTSIQVRSKNMYSRNKKTTLQRALFNIVLEDKLSLALVLPPAPSKKRKLDGKKHLPVGNI